MNYTNKLRIFNILNLFCVVHVTAPLMLASHCWDLSCSVGASCGPHVAAPTPTYNYIVYLSDILSCILYTGWGSFYAPISLQ